MTDLSNGADSRVLTSNGLPVRLDPDARLRDSTELLGDGAAIRERYLEDGYLYLRGFLDPAVVQSLRSSYFARFDSSYLEAGTDPAEGVFSGRRPEGLVAHGLPGHPAHGFVRQSEFQGFASSLELVGLAEKVLGGPAVSLPRRILRHFDCAAPIASRAHCDQPYLDQGSGEVATAWVPFGDCPPEGGGLVYLEGSHRVDPSRLASLRQVTDRPGDSRPLSHDLQWVSDELGLRWLWSNYCAGDVTIHAPRIIHASLDTTTRRVRLSADLRYMRAGQRADPRWLVPWAGDDGN
ncbi:MAG: phytanoyl-CoA dioxygenase family protein [Acidimicrobiales bacterium]